MGSVHRLHLQTLLVLWIICVANGAPYSKYGRTCKDIGCLPREVCVMSYESCSFSQQENVSCGRYPTCKKNTDVQATQQNSDIPKGPSHPPTTKPSTSIWNFDPPTAPTTTTRRTTTTTTTTRRPWTTQSPFYNPANPSYSGGGGYFGNRYGDSDDGGSSFTRPTTRYTTKRPSSSSGFDGFFSGLQNVLSGDIGKLISGALSNRGGSGSSSGGGFGSLFGGDTRPLIENKNSRGGLWSENTSGQGTRTSNSYNAYPVTRYGESNVPSAPPANPTPPQYGWKLS